MRNKEVLCCTTDNSITVHVDLVEDAAVLSTQVFPLVVFDSCPHGPCCCPGKRDFLHLHMAILFFQSLLIGLRRFGQQGSDIRNGLKGEEI